ncbi:MAG: hypothetical protein CMJ62_12735 [Planctomycetaceae bacterium]|nr:hypothetical protein [Planctomycetaceae bacterium]
MLTAREPRDFISGAVELQILVNEPRGLKAVFSFPSVSVFLSKVQIQKRLPTGTYTYRLICVPPAQSERGAFSIPEEFTDQLTENAVARVILAFICYLFSVVAKGFAA